MQLHVAEWYGCTSGVLAMHNSLSIPDPVILQLKVLSCCELVWLVKC